MTPRLKTHSTLVRALAATAAVALTAAVFVSNVGLADQYSAQAGKARATAMLVAGNP